MKFRLPQPRVLYLEDDADIRELMSDLLRESGFDVTPVETAAAALRELREAVHWPFQLLLTDYRLPHENADWLLARAASERLLTKTAVIVLSGEVDPPGIDGVPFLRKPVQTNVLFAQMKQSLATVASTPTPTPTASPPTATPPATPPAARAPVKLRLYVSASVASRRAERWLRDLVDRPERRQDFHLDVVDVTRLDSVGLTALDEDGVIVTPTLVMRAQDPAVCVLGDPSTSVVVVNALEQLAAP